MNGYFLRFLWSIKNCELFYGGYGVNFTPYYLLVIVAKIMKDNFAM